MFGKSFIHPIMMRLPPTFFTENFGSLSWAPPTAENIIQMKKRKYLQGKVINTGLE
jgi:hypothetical protein